MMTRSRESRPAAGLGTKLVVLSVAGLIALGLCEIAARVVFPAPPARARQPTLVYQTDPDLGFIHVASQGGWLDDGFATINALSLRGDAAEAPDDSDAFRVMAIGDSTTFGWGVNDDETYCAWLEQQLRHAWPGRRPIVMNAGVVSYDLEQSARLLRRVAPTLQPDLVLVGVFWNDLPYETVSPEGDPLAVPASAPPSVSTANGDSSAAAPRTFRMANQPSRWNLLLRESRLLYVLRHAWLTALAPTGRATNQVRWEMAVLEGRRTKAIDEAWRNIGTTLADIRAYADTAGFSVGVVIMPIRAQVDQSYPGAEYQTRVRALAEALGMFVVDPLPKFLADPDRSALFIPYDRMHFSAHGNRVLAEAVFDALRERDDLRHLATR